MKAVIYIIAGLYFSPLHSFVRYGKLGGKNMDKEVYFK